jgi:hypothetical protein
MTIPSSTKNSPKKLTPERLTSELVKAVSERVYALLQADLKLERERARRTGAHRRPSSRT